MYFRKNIIAAFQHVLLTQHEDKLLLVEMLTLPSEKYLSEQMQIIDPEAIHAAREYLLFGNCQSQQRFLIEALSTKSQNLRTCMNSPWKAVGKRQLKNLCLVYLLQLGDADYQKIAMEQFQTHLAENMTETIGALRALNHVAGKLREQALADFYQAWQQNALVVDKWFTLQALSKLPNTVEKVKALMRHPAFDLKNPNKSVCVNWCVWREFIAVSCAGWQRV